MNRRIHWTNHSQIKIRHYKLSKAKLLKLLMKPERRERGIVKNTMAVMKTNPSGNNLIRKSKDRLSSKKFIKKPPGEVWLMYKDIGNLRKIISAWRYPGISKPGQPIPIPEDIKEDIKNEILNL